MAATLGDMSRATKAIVVGFLLTACTGVSTSSLDDSPQLPSGSTTRPQVSAFTAAPPHVMDECSLNEEVAAACPTVLPAVEGPYRVGAFSDRPRSPDYRGVDISYGGAYPHLTTRNAPPGFVHIVVKVGDLTEGFPFRFPDPPLASPPLPSRYFNRPLALGRFTWGTKTGVLVLAPRYPIGGVDGGHLVFTWETDGADAAISLHAWSPLSDSVDILERLVASTP